MWDRPRAKRVDQSDFDFIDMASSQSFPASDPPAWVSGQLSYASPADDSPLSENRPSQAHGGEVGRNMPFLGPPHLGDK